jgi:histidyl-tRNA synthetase
MEMNEQRPGNSASGKVFRPKPRLPRGFRDRDEAELAAESRMLDTIRRVYASYGFQALETPAFEYTDALGKFLPDLDRPNEGVFSLKDDDGQWLSLRYDLTAPLARYVAENFQNLSKPFRRFQVGMVWRNEKPGPGRFREFTQCDADTVGSAAPGSDAELLMMCADCLEALGLNRGDYLVKLNSRKLLDGVMEAAGVDADPRRRGIVLRALDKMDRLGPAGVEALLGKGRRDESGDFTAGAELDRDQIARVLGFAAPAETDVLDCEATLAKLAQAISGSPTGEAGLENLSAIVRILNGCGYESDRVRIDSGVVRGLDYYTGAVFEAQLGFPVTNEAGENVVFGSIGGGGRYDALVARFTGQEVPATGISIGVSRLLSALRARAGAEAFGAEPLCVVLVLDKSAAAESFRIAQELRAHGLRAEAYAGDGGMKAQLKYADRRGAAIAIIEGGDERARGEITLKDLKRGSELAKSAETRDAWLGGRPAQRTVPRSELVACARAILSATDSAP